MDQALPVLFGVFCVLFLAGLVALAVFSARRERQRRDGLAAWARANGWSYLANPASNWPARLPGHNKRGVTFALTGIVNEHTVSVGEYQYTETHYNGKTTTSTTHRFVVVGLRLPGAYPPISVGRRGMFSKLGRSLFGDGPTVTGNAAFDEKFRVVTNEPTWVPAVLGPSLVAAHLAGQVPDWSVVGDELLTYFPATLRDPSAIPGWGAWLSHVAELIGR